MGRSEQTGTGNGDGTWMGPLPSAPGCDCQICRPEPSYDPMDRSTIDTVLQHGWQVLLIGADEGCDHPEHHDDHSDDHPLDAAPAFAYTVGLGHRAGHPELLMAGLDGALMHRALNDLSQQVLAGHRFAAGDVLEDVLGRVPVVLEQVSEEGLIEAVGWSGWFHRRPPEALMVVWPTTSGVFDWQPGAPASLDAAQPRRWRVPFVHGGGVAADPAWLLPAPPETMAVSCTHVVDDGHPVLCVARRHDDERGEEWSIHCGAGGHDAGSVRLTHLAHLVRGAPSLRVLAGIPVDHQAERPDVRTGWTVAPLR
jgi:hypothetical protein